MNRSTLTDQDLLGDLRALGLQPGATVVLLHGLGRTRLSMTVPSLRLRAAGYRVVNVGYPSRRGSIPDLAALVQRKLARRVGEDDGPVHFMTHSMGGIVLRLLLSRHDVAFETGRVVMIAPPNRGSMLAERLGDHGWFRAILGRAAQQLRSGGPSVPELLESPDYPVGVIAGSRAASPWSFLVRGASDGTVLVEETTLDGMADFLVVPRGHTFIMNDRRVVNQAIHFFRHGAFAHGDGTRAATRA